MAPTAKALPEALTVSPEAAATLRIAIVHARWNAEIIANLLEGAVNKLKAAGVKEQNIVVQSVPGSFELPLACSRRVTPIICVPTSLTVPQSHPRLARPGRVERDQR